MTDDIKSEIAKTSNRTKVFTLLKQLGDPLTLVEFSCSSAKGEFWIEKSARIFLAKSDGDGGNGLMALMQLLAGQEITFRVCPAPVEKPKGNVDIRLADLIANENGIIQTIKDELWPVEATESDIMTETTIPPIPADMLQQALSRKKEAVVQAKVVEDVLTEDAIELPPELTLKPEATAPSKPAAPAKEQGGSNIISKKDWRGKASDKAKAKKADGAAAAAASSEPAPSAASESPYVVDDSITESIDSPTAGAHPYFEQSLFDIDPLPDMEDVLEAVAPPQNPADAARPVQQPLGLVENLILQAAAEQEQEALIHKVSPEHPIEETKDTDPMTTKRRAEMRAMEIWYGEEPDKFFEKTENFEDDLLHQRRAEMSALNAMLEAHANLSKEIFQEREPSGPDNESEKRRKEFEVLREYFAENPDRFYEYCDLGADDPQGTEELRAKILNLMAQQRDPEAFEQRDGRVADESTLKMTWKEPEPEPEPELEPEPINPELIYEAPDLEPSVFGDDTSQLNYAEKHKGKLNVGTVADDKSLLDRPPNRANKFGFIDRDKLRMPDKIPRHILVAAAILAGFMPIFALYMYHHLNMTAEADYEDQRAASQLAAEAAQEESRVRKPKEAFRMPDSAPMNGTPPPNRSASNESAYGGGVTEDELSGYHWTAPQKAAAQPTADQANKAARALALGEQQLALGRVDEAARTFSAGLLECPNNPALRIRAARAYMMLKQYATAKDILISGMNEAASQTEFMMYLAVMRDMPRI